MVQKSKLHRLLTMKSLLSTSECKVKFQLTQDSCSRRENAYSQNKEVQFFKNVALQRVISCNFIYFWDKRPKFSYNFHLGQANITLLVIEILVQFWKFVGGLEDFSDQGGGIEFPVFKIFKGGSNPLICYGIVVKHGAVAVKNCSSTLFYCTLHQHNIILVISYYSHSSVYYQLHGGRF